MLKVKKQSNFLFKSNDLIKILSKKRIHFLQFFCWISLILVGTFLIGISTNLYSKQYQYCQDSQTFCTRQFILNDAKDLLIYVVMDNFYQNNRMQLFQRIFFQVFRFLQSLTTSRQYKQQLPLLKLLYVWPTRNKQQCWRLQSQSNHQLTSMWKVMTNIFNDVVYLITSQGGSIQLDKQDLRSGYNKQYKFKNLQNYQLRQWIDMQSNNFVNYFTTAYTSTKYYLIGKVSLSPDTYQIIIKNNYLTKGTFNKRILVTESNQIGTKDPIIGFYLFVAGIVTAFFHLFLCFRGFK